MAAVGRVFSGSGLAAAANWQPVGPRPGHAAQSAELRGGRRAATAWRRRPIIRMPGFPSLAASWIVTLLFAAGGFCAGCAGQPRADRWRFAMNEVAHFECCSRLSSPAGRCLPSWRIDWSPTIPADDRPPCGRARPAPSTPNIRKLPADSQGDWLAGFTLTERSGAPSSGTILRARCASSVSSSRPARRVACSKT